MAYGVGTAEENAVSVYEVVFETRSVTHGTRSEIDESGRADFYCAKDNVRTELTYGSVYV